MQLSVQLLYVGPVPSQHLHVSLELSRQYKLAQEHQPIKENEKWVK